MAELRDLYQESILDHSKHPRNFREPERFSRKADGYNPLCGDRITVFLALDGDVVEDVSFVGAGCAISTASASLMTESLKGKTLDQLGAMAERFHEMLTGDDDPPEELGKLTVLAGVREFPVRVKCATLAWHTVRAALDPRAEPVTTE